jgi:hypothetical protein
MRYNRTYEEVPLRIDDLYWDENNVEHLWRSHRVTPEEVQEIIFGIGGGRLLKLVGEFRAPRVLRVFGAIDMDATERRIYRKGEN